MVIYQKMMSLGQLVKQREFLAREDRILQLCRSSIENRALRSSKNCLILKREHASIYRLYQFGLSIEEIVDMTKSDRSSIQQTIGSLFKKQCLKSDDCIVKPFLNNV